MELQFERKPWKYLRRVVWESKDQEQTQEVRLPDGMPDIGSIIGAWGHPLLRGKEWNNDGIAVSGGIMAWVLYGPADGSSPRMMEIWLPVNMKWNMPDSGKMGSIRCHWQLKGVDGRVLSARKLMVRANVSILAEALEGCEEEISVASQVPEDVELLQNTYPARLFTEAGEKAFVLDEELQFSSAEPMPERLIAVSMVPELTEQKVLEGKVVFRGNGHFRVLYQDGEGMIRCRRHQATFSQLSDLDRDHSPEGQASVWLAMSSLEPEVADGRIRLKCGMVAQYAVSDCMMLQLTEDAYSPVRAVEPQMSQLKLPMILDQRQEAVSYLCNLDTVGDVVDVFVMAQQPTVRRSGEACTMSCDGQVQVLYYDEGGRLQGRTGRWSAGWELPTAQDVELLATMAEWEEPRVSLGDGQMQVNGTLMLEALAVAQSPMDMVMGLELGEAKRPDPGRPSLILRRPQSASLWELAKTTGSTVNAIRNANGLDEEPVGDRLLLIPVI